MTSYTNLDLVNRCDNVPYIPNTSQFPVIFKTSRNSTFPIGLIRRVIWDELYKDTSGDWVVESNIVTFASHIQTPTQRQNVVERTIKEWKFQGKFSILQGWRNELYPVMDRPSKSLHSIISFVMERAATPLFGIYTFGVHLTIYTPDYKIYVPRRSSTKQTFPLMLDNSVAGGITYGDGPRETLIRECMEEASLNPEHIENAKCTGAVTYFYQSENGEAKNEGGWLQPETQIVYDLKLTDSSIQLCPNDGEVEEFYLWKIDQVKEYLKRGEFAPNCAIIMIDFFIRHGILTPENEPHFLDILPRLRRRLDFPAPHYDIL